MAAKSHRLATTYGNLGNGPCKQTILQNAHATKTTTLVSSTIVEWGTFPFLFFLIKGLEIFFKKTYIFKNHLSCEGQKNIIKMILKESEGQNEAYEKNHKAKLTTFAFVLTT